MQQNGSGIKFKRNKIFYVQSHSQPYFLSTAVSKMTLQKLVLFGNKGRGCMFQNNFHFIPSYPSPLLPMPSVTAPSGGHSATEACHSRTVLKAPDCRTATFVEALEFKRATALSKPVFG